jgi:hypothetical protein
VSKYSLTHLTDGTLLHHFETLAARDRHTTAELLACIAEIDARKLYSAAAYESMFAYCVRELRFSEDVALKRIRVARIARRIPAIFEAVADGRMNLSAILLLRPNLTKKTAHELLAAAANKTNAEIRMLLAERFPKPDLPTAITPISTVTSSVLPVEQVAVRPVDSGPDDDEPIDPGTVESPDPRARVEPLAPQRFALRMTIGQHTLDKLRHAQELLSHQIPSGDISEVLDRALDALILKLEKTKFGATEKPRSGQPRTSTNGRYIPAHVKRAVRNRDEGQCTYVSDTGKRCTSRKFLEFDHVLELARGGQSTVEGLRLRCRAHNAFTAELTFGAEFMKDKREAARQAAVERRAVTQQRAAAAQARASAKAPAAVIAEAAEDKDVVPWLRALGFRADEARRAAERCENMPDASIEERVRVALSAFAPRMRRAASSPAT